MKNSLACIALETFKDKIFVTFAIMYQFDSAPKTTVNICFELDVNFSKKENAEQIRQMEQLTDWIMVSDNIELTGYYAMCEKKPFSSFASWLTDMKRLVEKQ